MTISKIILNKVFTPQNLKFKREDFYIKIHGYGKNKEWADEIIKTADLAASLIQRNTSGENVLKIITHGVKNANQHVIETSKKLYTGILRNVRQGWKSHCSDLTTRYSYKTYKSYESRIDKMKGIDITVPEKGLGVTKPSIVDGEKQVIHGSYTTINNSLDYIFKLYKNLFPKYLNKNLTEKNLEDINLTIAEIRWVLAQSTPWMRGSDSIANVFIRAIYKALGIKTFPLKKGVSLDLEAFCTSLKDYKTNFTNYFEKNPLVIKNNSK